MSVVRHKGLWFVVSIGCYMTGVGGMIYCIIRNPKPHGFNQVWGGLCVRVCLLLSLQVREGRATRNSHTISRYIFCDTKPRVTSNRYLAVAWGKNAEE